MSLNSKEDRTVEVEVAWQREVQRRLKQIKKGEVRMIPWETAKRRLRRHAHS